LFAVFLHLGFENAILDSCNFSHMVLNDTCWKQSHLKACIFNETHLQKADFSGARLTQTLFHHSSLQGASEYAINPLTNKLNKAKFSQPEVMSLLQYLDIIVESSPN
jgi:fluoroquinolone resistance protein